MKDGLLGHTVETFKCEGGFEAVITEASTGHEFAKKEFGTTENQAFMNALGTVWFRMVDSDYAPMKNSSCPRSMPKTA